jgi:hypothetical protein
VNYRQLSTAVVGISLLLLTPAFADEDGGGVGGAITRWGNRQLGNDIRDGRIGVIERDIAEMKQDVHQLRENHEKIKEEFERLLHERYRSGS